MNERALRFGRNRHLVGVVTEPEQGATRRPCLILLNAGLIHHIGPNRIHVRLARRLAARGWCVLRFDLSGIGDSGTGAECVPFAEQALLDVCDAVDLLVSMLGATRVFVGGLCLGADVGLRAAFEDERITGVVAINGVQLGGSIDADAAPDERARVLRADARTRARYYWMRLLSPSAWWRFLTGRSDWSAARGTLATLLRLPTVSRGSTAQLAQRSRHCRALAGRGGRILLVLCEGSTALDLYHQEYEEALAPLVAEGGLRLAVFPHVDHVFTLRWSQEQLFAEIERWLDEPYGAGTPAGATGSAEGASA